MEKNDARAGHIRKIAITGPESTGKSTLAADLARHYHTVWVPEFARSYLEKINRPYNETDLLNIARGQWNEEIRLTPEASNGFLFSDTEMLVLKIWSMHKYGRCHPEILEKLNNPSYDLYLLCDIDLPWEADPQREHPHLREHFLQLYMLELDALHVPYEIITGKSADRKKQAVEAIDRHLT
ncbi:MAG: ATP-binding protein [Fulvivirga sp.]|nr:ATP-binding protein [Fulvivirga sp.]